MAVGGALLVSGSLLAPSAGVLYAGLLGLFVVVLLAAPTLRFADIAGEPEKEVLHYEEGVAGVVKVATDVYDRKLLSINGWSVAGTGTPNRDVALVNDYPEVQKMLAHLPMLLHPAPRRALVIGFGAGGTVWSLSRYAALERIDVVEFVPGVIRAASFFPEVNHGVLADPRVSVTIDDGRNYLLVTPHTYDVVSVDTLDPKHAGNGNLYTREFYELSKRVLKPGGIFVQWLPYHQVDNASLKMIARTFQHAYPHATMWLNRFKGYTLLLGHPRAPADRRGKARSALPHSRHPGRPRRGARGHAVAIAGELHHASGHVAALHRRQFAPQHLRPPLRGVLRRLLARPRRGEPRGAGALCRRRHAAPDVLRRLSPRRSGSPVTAWPSSGASPATSSAATWPTGGASCRRGPASIARLSSSTPRTKASSSRWASPRVHKQQALATLERHPGDIKSLSKLGYIAWSEQDYDEAIRRFQQVLAIDPRHAAAYVHLGVSYAAQERHAASIAAYREAGRLQPDLATLVTQSIELVEHRRRAAEHPDDPAVQAGLGELYAGDGRSDRAVECFEKVVALAPHRPQGFFTLARHYEAEERDAEALRTYGQGLALEPGNAQARNNYEKLAIKAALESGKPVALSLGTDQTVAIDPQSATSYYQLGLRYLKNDEADAAVGALQQAIALRPDFDAAHLFLGLAYTSLGAHAKAEARIAARSPSAPRIPTPTTISASCTTRSAATVRPSPPTARPSSQAPDYAVAYVNLAASHEALGQTEQALTAYRQALQRDANLAAVQERIDALGKKSGK